MEIPITNLLHSEVILQEFGFKRLFRWKIDKKNYLIQLCPNMKHIHIMSTNMVRNLNNYEPLCQECVGRIPRNLDNYLKDIYQHEHLMFKLFQILDRDEFKKTILWKEINSNLLGQTLFSHYLEAKNKHFYNPKLNQNDISVLNSEGSPDNLSESFDMLDLDRKNKLCDSFPGLPHSNLINANHNYFGIIVKLDKENVKLREDVKLLDEIIEEQNDMINHFKQFLHNNHDIYNSFKLFHQEIYPNEICSDEISNNSCSVNTPNNNILIRLVNNGKILNNFTN